MARPAAKFVYAAGSPETPKLAQRRTVAGFREFGAVKKLSSHSGTPPQARLRASSMRYSGGPGIQFRRKSLRNWIPGSRPKARLRASSTRYGRAPE
ncbi:MAG: hypothetical protein K2Y27_05775 [Xanthobacteraceae bacterium]|nr:hypothetical protein [Xanthobacteraceae bacterium]